MVHTYAIGTTPGGIVQESGLSGFDVYYETRKLLCNIILHIAEVNSTGLRVPNDSRLVILKCHLLHTIHMNLLSAATPVARSPREHNRSDTPLPTPNAQQSYNTTIEQDQTTD